MTEGTQVPVPVQEPLGPSSTGLDPTVAAMLAYLLGWLSGLVIYLIERDSRYVRFHAMQSIIALGALWALGVSSWLAALVFGVLFGSGFELMVQLAQIVWIVSVIVWLVCLWKAYAGERWKLPVAGDLAERIAGR